MGNPTFYFKNFKIHQDQCAMKISTDAVLMGATATFSNPSTILDIGTGTGVIALMLAQRFPQALITAVEIEEKAFHQAQSNFLQSPWQERLTIKNQDFNDFCLEETKGFDLIVSNPPYYSHHLTTKNVDKNIALHQESLTFAELILGVKKLMNPLGQFWLILPPDQMKALTAIALKNGLYPVFIQNIYDRPGLKMIRQIQVFSFDQVATPDQFDFFIKNENHMLSTAYVALLKDFLLKL
jgi:tRNA1Val (adenine37-N6)-methyltransferase